MRAKHAIPQVYEKNKHYAYIGKVAPLQKATVCS